MKTKENLFFTLLFISFTPILLKAQPGGSIEVGSFETTIIFNGEPSNVAYYVPLDYDSLTSYKLVVGLHYCDGTSNAYKSYRNRLKGISDSLNAIIMCPDCHNGNYPYNVPDISIIPKSIDSTKNIYNIDEDYIYLTGASCNGKTTLKYGLEYIYNFRGIISFIPFIPSVPYGYYDFDSGMPTCICAGTLDQYYNNAVELYDSLVAHQANAKLISMEGIGHEIWIPEFNIKMMNGFHYIDSIANTITSSKSDHNNSFNVSVFPNPVEQKLFIEINNNQNQHKTVSVYNMLGYEIINQCFIGPSTSINMTSLSSGIYLIKIEIQGKRQ